MRWLRKGLGLANTYGLGLGLGLEVCFVWLLMFPHLQTVGMRDNDTKRRTKVESSEKG